MPRAPKKQRRNPPISLVQWQFLKGLVHHRSRHPQPPPDPSVQVGEGDGEVKHALAPKPKPYAGMRVEVYDSRTRKLRHVLERRGLIVETTSDFEVYCNITEDGLKAVSEFVLSPLKPSDIKVNRTYRAKKPGEYLFAGKNDRTVVWTDGIRVQYDGPSVKWGRHYPKVLMDDFLWWAEKDVTSEVKATST